MNQQPSASAALGYFIPPASHYPVVLAASLFLLALGFVLQINGYGLGAVVVYWL